MDNQVAINGNVYQDETAAVAATHPEIPDELKSYFKSDDQPYRGPNLGPLSPEGSPSGTATGTDKTPVAGMPLGSSTEPAGAFDSGSGIPVAPLVQGSPEPSYETELTPEQKTQYDTKFDSNASQDYDMQGYFAAHPDVEPNAEGVHYPDTFKKPNHMTFSDESQYHGVNGNEGGHWGTDADGKDTFTPGPTNLAQHTPQELKDYFAKVEPDVKLILPQEQDIQGDYLKKLTGTSTPRPVFDILKDLVGNKIEKFKDALSAPGDAYAGKLDPSSPQGMERINNLAQMMVTGPAPVASRMADGTLGSFMGVKSKTIDKSRLYAAQEHEMNGVHPDDIWNQTQTFRGADGRWRQEIPDQNLNIIDKGTILHPAEPIKGNGWNSIEPGERLSVKPSAPVLPNDASLEDMIKFLKTPQNDIRLGHILDHPELYNAYPFLKNIKVRPMPEGLPYLGMARGGNEIYMAKQPVEDFTSTLMHEVQHIIQSHEGFATGANTNMFLSREVQAAEQQLPNLEKEFMKAKSLDKDSLEHYIGVVQYSRNVQLQNMSPGVRETVEKAIDEMKDKGIYQGIRNLTDARKLLSEAKSKATENYNNVMGEVESRNVQGRMNLNHLDRLINNPRKTEEMMVPRSKQIAPADIYAHQVSQ